MRTFLSAIAAIVVAIVHPSGAPHAIVGPGTGTRRAKGGRTGRVAARTAEKTEAAEAAEKKAAAKRRLDARARKVRPRARRPR